MRPAQLRNSAALAVSLGFAALTLAAGCETNGDATQESRTLPPPPPPDAVAMQEVLPEGAFSADRAWSHLSALAEIGPRVTGTPGASRARDYILGQLAENGIDVLPADTADTVVEGSPNPRQLSRIPDDLDPQNILAEIPGESDDLIVLVAPYDSRQFESFEFLGVNDGASGTALLLELARVLSRAPLPYTTWLLFLDAEAPRGDGPHTSMDTQLFGSRLQAARFRLDGVLPRVRMLVAFNFVCDADLGIGRDLQSHRLYREDFWEAAQRLGHRKAFSNEGSFVTPGGSHLSFFLMGARRVVFIGDVSHGGDEAPGLYADTEDDDLDHCSPESLGVVGSVSVEALSTIARRLAKIDRFSTSPLAKLESEKPEDPEESEVDSQLDPFEGLVPDSSAPESTPLGATNDEAQ